jgi:cytochrome b6-f complex iron-sulfur subunit
MVGVRLDPIQVLEDEPVEDIVVDEVLEVEAATTVVTVLETQRVVEVTPEESGVTRRQFFNRALSATFFAFLGMQGVYYLAFFWPKLSGGFGSDVDAGEIGEIQTAVFASDGSILPLFVPEAKAYIVPAPSSSVSEQFEGKSVATDNLMALFQRCVHLGCRVPWCGPSQGFECPCHGSKYNSVGQYFAGPAPRNLDRFVVENQNNRLIIRTGQVVETSRAPTLTVSYPQGPSCIGGA